MSEPHPDDLLTTLQRVVATHGLMPPTGPYAPDLVTWEWLTFVCRHERLAGLLYAAVLDGVITPPDDAADDATELLREAMTACLRAEQLLVEASAALNRAGIGHWVLKGSAAAALDYDEPWLRPFADADLLVRTPDYALALEVLATVGLTRATPPVRPGFDARFGKGATLCHTDGREVDLHRLLVNGRFGLTIPEDDLVAGAEPFPLGDRTLWALRPAGRLLHACLHSVLTGGKLVTRRDIANLVLTRTDPAEVQATAAHWQAEPVLAAGITEAWHTLGLTDRPALVTWARSYEPPAWARRAMTRYRDDGYRGQALTALPVIPGLRAKAAYLASLALPSRANLAARGRSAWANLARIGRLELRRFRQPAEEQP